MCSRLWGHHRVSASRGDRLAVSVHCSCDFLVRVLVFNVDVKGGRVPEYNAILWNPSYFAVWQGISTFFGRNEKMRHPRVRRPSISFRPFHFVRQPSINQLGIAHTISEDARAAKPTPCSSRSPTRSTRRRLRCTSASRSATSNCLRTCSRRSIHGRMAPAGQEAATVGIGRARRGGC